MKKSLSVILFLLSSLTSFSQEASVEKSVFGIQTGVLGLWGHNESRLSNSIALRTEIGLDGGIWDGSYWDKTGFMLTPVISVEPRWYYNLNKRLKKEKRIDGNSGNFVALKTTYRPDLFVISNYDHISVVPSISVIPTWGIRRNLGKHFNYELGVGLGYIYYFHKQLGYQENEADTAGRLHLRIGYRF